MRKVIRYQTADGQLHDTPERAARHADELYGSELTAMAWELSQIGKYKLMIAFLESNLERFRGLLELRADIAMDAETDQEEEP